jgi:hypothetical protein
VDAPLTIVMVVAPAGAGAGVDDGEVLLPHAETHTRHKIIAKTRIDIMMSRSLVPPSRKDAARRQVIVLLAFSVRKRLNRFEFPHPFRVA